MPPAAPILERDEALGEKLARALDTRAAADLAAVGIAPERVPAAIEALRAVALPAPSPTRSPNRSPASSERGSVGPAGPSRLSSYRRPTGYRSEG